MFGFLSTVGFREKSVWVTAAIMVYLWTWYARAVVPGIIDGTLSRPETIGLFIGMTVSVIVLEVIAHIILAVVSPRDANAPEDERDRLICQRAESHAAWMMGAGIVTICMFAMFREVSALAMIHTLLLLLIAVEVLSNALQILYYRRGL